MSLAHIRGVQPSKAAKKTKKPQTTLPRLQGLHKNVLRITAAKTKAKTQVSSFGINNMMDQKCFQFFVDNFKSSQFHTRVPINTQECINFLKKYNAEFVVERTQEISGSKVLITTTAKKRNMATFVIRLPVDYTPILVFFILLKVDFGGVQIELSQTVGRVLEKFVYKSKEAGFRFYYDFIRLNIANKRFIIVRNQF